MKLEIWDDKYLVHFCPPRPLSTRSDRAKSFYRIDKQGYYNCTECKIRIPSMLFTLPYLVNNCYGYYGICPPCKKMITIEL